MATQSTTDRCPEFVWESKHGGCCRTHGSALGVILKEMKQVLHTAVDLAGVDPSRKDELVAAIRPAVGADPEEMEKLQQVSSCSLD